MKKKLKTSVEVICLGWRMSFSSQREVQLFGLSKIRMVKKHSINFYLTSSQFQHTYCDFSTFSNLFSYFLSFSIFNTHYHTCISFNTFSHIFQILAHFHFFQLPVSPTLVTAPTRHSVLQIRRIINLILKLTLSSCFRSLWSL